MRDLIVGDLHLGSKLYGAETIIEHLRSIITQLNPDRVFLLGDLFDRSVPDPRWVYTFLRVMHDVEWYAIDGNHDIHSGFVRSALMVFGYEFGKIQVVDNYALVPWSYVLNENIKTSEDFWSSLKSYNYDYVLTHFCIEHYPKSELLRGRELVLSCHNDKYLISGHIHEGQLFDKCEHTGSFTPVKINELSFDRWVLVVEDHQIVDRVKISWPYQTLSGDFDYVKEYLQSFSPQSKSGVLIIDTSDSRILSADLEVPYDWVLRIRYTPPQKDSAVQISSSKSGRSINVSVESVVEQLISKEVEYDKEGLLDAWERVKKIDLK